jgi:predicted Zn-dependent protease
VLTRAEAVALAETVMRLVSVPTGSVVVTHRATAVAKIVNTRRLHCFDHDELELNFFTVTGSQFGVDVRTNVRDVETLKDVIHSAETGKGPSVPIEYPKPDDLDDPKLVVEGPRTYLPVTLWHESTVQGMETGRGDALAQMVAVMRAAQQQSPDLMMAGTVAVTERARIAHYQLGRSAWGESTDSEITVSARSVDGRASGWQGHASRDWATLQPERIVRDAVTMANRTRGAVRVEPGRYTAILGPAAVGQLVAQMHDYFLASANRDIPGPFSLLHSPDGRKLRLGQRVFDERISMYTDPNDPMGGDDPFFPNGYPSGKETWIENGVLRALAYDPKDAVDHGKAPPVQQPYAIHVTGGTTTIEEMIAQCERGVYVHRFSGVQIVDGNSGTLTGWTRDGCFLVKERKIHSPIINFRFYESPFLVFNRVLAVGVPERVALGTSTDDIRRGVGATLDSWPSPPIIVPPLMVRDFNFVSLADAV